MGNSETQSIECQLIDSLKRSEIDGLVVDYAEIGLDKVLDNDIIQDIPILKSLVALAKISLNIRDKLYVKKVYNFLINLYSH